MATNKKPAPNEAAQDAPTPEARRWAARTMADGAACGVVTAKYMFGIGNGAADANDLKTYVAETVRNIAAGDLSALETMLLQQSTTLRAMFAALAMKAQAQTSWHNLQTATALAPKAAAGSRQAITALAELRMPKQVLFAKQANIAQQQRVNNGPAPAGAPDPARAGAEESQTRQNGLSRGAHGLLEDAGASSAVGCTLPAASPVGGVHRPANR